MRKVLLYCAVFISIQNYYYAQLTHSNEQVYALSDEEKGKELFNNKCRACHNIGKLMFGPALCQFDDIAKSYKPNKVRHKKIKITAKELRLIADYVNKNKVYIDKY